jgi:ribosome-associated protein
MEKFIMIHFPGKDNTSSTPRYIWCFYHNEGIYFIKKGLIMDISRLYASIRTHGNVSFSRSGGPGGQNVNKVNTKACLRLKIGDLEGLSETEITRLRSVLAPRITAEDEIVINSSEERSQRVNLERSYLRLEALISTAARLPKHRRPTKPGRAAKENRLQRKHLHSRKKTDRKSPFED